MLPGVGRRFLHVSRDMHLVRALAVLYLAACGGSVVTQATTHHDDSGDDAHETSTTESGLPQEAGTDANGARARDGGTLLLQAFGDVSGAVFAQVPPLGPGVGQQQTCGAPRSAGACTLTSCVLGGFGTPQGDYGNFGTIYASIGTTTEAVTYNEGEYGVFDFPSSVRLGTGGTMIFHGGNGGSVPVFDVTATIPGLAVLTSPVPMTDGGSAVIDASHDLIATWVPISLGEITFELAAGSGPVGSTAISIVCTFGGAAASGVVPQALLSSLKAMGSGPVYAGVSSELSSTTVVGGLTIETQSFQKSQTTVQTFAVSLQ
jgi:hypothetical protein